MEAITYLKTSGVYPNPQQPRKHFDKTAMEELTASIQSIGVLQPIIVRPVKSKKGHEIVCGERRWRAATAAGLETIPCVIRQLTDEEAMDVAITENLQRKDVDPFEEAHAFLYLINKGQSFDDIAARFGKSSVFVRGRVKLGDLIEPLRMLYESKDIPVSHCLELCKLTADIQTKIHDAKYTTPAGYGNSWRDSSLHQIRRGLDAYMKELKSAPFDKTECSTCPKNTAVCGLFDDLREVSCSDTACFENKVIEARVQKVIKKHESNPGIILYTYHDGSERGEKVFARLKEEGIAYYSSTSYSQVYGLDKPQKRKDESEEDFSNRMTKHKQRMDEVNAKIEAGEYARAMRIDDFGFGQEAVVYSLKSDRSAGVATPETTINDLKLKDDRNKELRIEKTIEEVAKLYWIKKDDRPAGAPLSDLEVALMYYCMSDYNVQNRLLEYRKPVATNIDRLLAMTEEDKIKAVRHFLHDKLPIAGHTPACEINIELYKQWFPEEAAAIETKHREVYGRRKKSIDARIAELSAKK